MKTNTLSNLLIHRLFSKNTSSFATLAKRNLNLIKSLNNKNILFTPIRKHISFYRKQSFLFSEEKSGPLKPEQIPAQNLQVVQTEEKLQDEDVQVFHTKGTLSILDKVQGTKTRQSGDLYVLMFTCGQCNAKQIKSFTKNAYHKGVVLARCIGCEKIHLVADNLGWFGDQPANVETLHKDTIKKVHDHAAINAFLNKAFEDEKQLLQNPSDSSEQPQEQNNTTEKKQ